MSIENKIDKKQQFLMDLMTNDFSSACVAENVLGNIGIHSIPKTLRALSNEEIAASVIRVMNTEVFLFERTTTGHVVYFLRGDDGNFIPAKNAKEEEGITFADIQALYDAASTGSLSFERLTQLAEPLSRNYKHGKVDEQ
ncbi:hypothetical protein KA012_01035 [Candidatus Woesebacteria bacterium]|nr:hypothetical protein [Candidatus Woesebacteria bacterium]